MIYVISFLGIFFFCENIIFLKFASSFWFATVFIIFLFQFEKDYSWIFGNIIGINSKIED